MSGSQSQSLEVTLEQLLEPALEEKGLELIELSISGSARRYILRLFVDRPSGISIGECAQLSRHLADVLDTKDPIQGAYVLEVSSPGLTRPLKSTRDFERALGKKIKVITRTGPVYTGKLDSVSERQLTLDIDGETVEVALNDVSKANLHFEI
jgi:ribosome maturation factor RimP